MLINGYDIQPIMLYLPDTEVWRNRYAEGKKHFEEQGIENIISVRGIYGHGFGIMGTHLYEHDNPGGGHQIGIDRTAGFLSMYCVYNVENNLPNSHFLYLEDDTRFKQGWREIVEQALKEIPADFDFLFIGSCCAEGIYREKVGTNLYKFKYHIGRYMNYPLCGNAYIISKKAIPIVLDTQRDAFVNVDINLAIKTFQYLNVYAILPRVCEQLNNEHLPQ